jgi:hypothetical protein
LLEEHLSLVPRPDLLTATLLLLLLLAPPAFANSKDQGKWATIYQWCANSAPEYLFDASFDEWMDACLDGRGKKKRR